MPGGSNFIHSINSISQFKQAINQSLLHSATLLNFSSKISNPWEVGIPKVEESNVGFAEALVYQCSFGVFGSSIIPSNAGWGGNFEGWEIPHKKNVKDEIFLSRKLFIFIDSEFHCDCHLTNLNRTTLEGSWK